MHKLRKPAPECASVVRSGTQRLRVASAELTLPYCLPRQQSAIAGKQSIVKLCVIHYCVRRVFAHSFRPQSCVSRVMDHSFCRVSRCITSGHSMKRKRKLLSCQLRTLSHISRSMARSSAGPAASAPSASRNTKSQYEVNITVPPSVVVIHKHRNTVLV